MVAEVFLWGTRIGVVMQYLYDCGKRRGCKRD